MKAIVRGSAFFAAAVLLLACLLMGCNDDGTSDMAKQISGGSSPAASPSSSASSAPNPGAATTADKPVKADPGAASVATKDPADPKQANDPAALPEGQTEQPADGTEPEVEPENAEPEYDGPIVEVSDFTVKAPYPEYDEEGRYDVKFDIKLTEYHDPAVWRIILYDDDHNIVSEWEEFLKIPNFRPKGVQYQDNYCSAKPVTAELRITEKTGTRAEDMGTAEEGGSGAGMESGRGAK